MANPELSLYQAKRDFTKTDEPSGKARVKPAEFPRFVIQKHAAETVYCGRGQAENLTLSSCTKPSSPPIALRVAIHAPTRDCA
jgi:bifunctional non-homologous end joining protein LigD